MSEKVPEIEEFKESWREGTREWNLLRENLDRETTGLGEKAKEMIEEFIEVKSGNAIAKNKAMERLIDKIYNYAEGYIISSCGDNIDGVNLLMCKILEEIEDLRNRIGDRR